MQGHRGHKEAQRVTEKYLLATFVPSLCPPYGSRYRVRWGLDLIVYSIMFNWRTALFANFFIFKTFYDETVFLKSARPILIVLFLCFAGAVHSQKQLILLKRENVLLRLYPGDEFIYRLNGSKTVRTTYVNNLSDTAV